MAYTFDSIFAVDPNNPSNVAKNASITIFDPADATKAPVAITDPTGSPLLNPITLDAAGMGPAFQHATLDRLGWTGGGFTGYFTSFEGIKAAAVAAQAAAETAGADAAAAASADLAAAVADAEAAQAAAATSATAAANSAALVNAPADTAVETLITGTGTATRAALNATYDPAERPAWATSKHKFDPASSTYNLSTRSLPRWQAALARASSGGANAHLMVGADSIGRGAGANVPFTNNSWPGILRDALVRIWGTQGGQGGWNTFQDEASTSADPLTVVTGFVRDGARGLHQEGRSSTATGQTIVYGPLVSTKFRIKYAIRADGGQFTWKINSGATTTVDTLNATEGIGTVEITASTIPAANTLTIASLGANVTILAMEATTADTGRVKVTRGARNGAKIGNFTFDTTPASALKLWPTLAPDLLVLALETNDFDQQTPIATYKAQIETAITTADANNCDVLLVATIPPNLTEVIPLADYTRALYELADQYDLPLLDMQHKWGSFAEANAAPFSYFADTLHPSQKGHYEYARTVFNVVASTWQQAPTVATDQAQSWSAVQRFGYPNHSSEQIDIGGLDLYTGSSGAPATPYMLATSAGALHVSAKTGQAMSVFSDVNMQAKAFVPVNTANAAVRARGAVEIEKVAAPTGNPAGGGFYLFVDPTDSLLKVKGPTGVVQVINVT